MVRIYSLTVFLRLFMASPMCGAEVISTAEGAEGKALGKQGDIAPGLDASGACSDRCSGGMAGLDTAATRSRVRRHPEFAGLAHAGL